MSDAAPEQPKDEGSAQQNADLSNLEFIAANEDYTPSPEAMQAEQGEAQPEISTGEMCSSLLMIGFNLIGSRRGDHWNLSQEEASETGNAVGAVLDKYFPDMSNQGVEITAVMTCAMVLTPRLMADKQYAQQRREHIERERQRTNAAEAQETGDIDGDQSESPA
jgi:hypothetical protein